jgi:polyhydroxybutyrate depolymerase
MRASPLAACIGALVVFAVAQAQGACDGNVGEAGAVKLTVGSVQRTALVRLPASYDARSPRPVLFVFHGFTMTAHLMESLVNFSEAWPEAIVVYPQGLPRRFERWGPGSQPGWQITAGELDGRDLAFFDAMLGWLRAHHCVDERRVFATGFSNGGYFSHLLGCERAQALAAIAPAAGGAKCQPKSPLPVLMTHGTADTLVDYTEAVQAAADWSRRDGCKQPPKTGERGCAAAQSCAQAPVILCTHPGGHHYDESFTAEAVRFFKAVKPKTR